MKKFFAIFGICFASLVVVLGGYVGVKYLLGHFNPVTILPENIAFESEEYYFDEGGEYLITITTTTEGVTEKKVSLQLAKNCKETIDKRSWTDGVIIIPKVAYIGEPFQIQLVKDNTYANELSDDALQNWIKGGVSNIVATSENKLANPANATIYVDTPVYKTELIILNKNVSTNNNITFENQFKNVETSNFVSIITDDLVPDVNSGETFYVGMKYYPSASAFKYGKVSSTNILVEYKTEILNKLQQLNYTENNLYAQIKNLFSIENTEIDVNDVLSLQKQLVSTEGADAQLNQFFENLLLKFNSSLKYNNIIEKNLTTNKVQINGKVAGTNLYEMTALQNLGATEFYTYTFKQSNLENEELKKHTEDGQDILQVLESAYESQKVIKNTNKINIADVEVDTMVVNGKISDLYTNSTHVIYANKAGINNKTTSYLNIKLSNSILSEVNLENKIKNVGIKFQKQLGTNWVDAGGDIKFKNSAHATENYQINIKNEAGEIIDTYYKPYGDANYWEIYAENYNEAIEYRVVIKYFIETKSKDDPTKTIYEVINVLEQSYPKFVLLEASSTTEEMVSWKSLDAVELKVINLTNVLNVEGGNISKNEEYNLANNVNRTLLNQNVFTTLRYFIYSDNGEILSNFFDTKTNEGVEYSFTDGNKKTLYELKSSILKLKNLEDIPLHSVKAIFVTIKTDINGTPIMADDNHYTVIKYSATKDTSLERLSSMEFTFTESLSTLSGTLEILNEQKAGMVTEIVEKNGTQITTQTFKIANDAQNVLSVIVSSDASESVMFDNALKNEQIKVVLKESYNTSTVYSSYEMGLFADSKMPFALTTRAVSSDVVVSAFIVYTISGQDFYFDVSFTYDKIIDGGLTQKAQLNSYTIVKDVNSSAKFAITNNTNEIIENLDYIKIQTKLNEGEIVQVISAILTDGTTIEGLANNSVFNEYGEINYTLKNFLGNNDEISKWHVETDNKSVMSVGDDGKMVSVMGTGIVIISLYIESETDPRDQIKFIIENNGYVESYAYINSGTDQNTVVSYDGKTNIFDKTQLQLSAIGNNKQIILIDDKTIATENTSLLAMWYNIDGQSTKLKFNIILDESSIETYNAISGITYNAGSNLSALTIAENLGQTVDLNLIYSCEVLTIKVSLKILHVTTVTDIKIEYKETINGTTEAKEVEKTTKYEVYAGKSYTFTTTINNEAKTAYYYLLVDSNYKYLFAATNGVGTYAFDDVPRVTTLVLYISDRATAPKIGQLQHAITMEVKPNITVTKEVYANSRTINVELNSNGTKTIDITDIFAREALDSNALKLDQFKLTNANTAFTYASNGKITFTFIDGNIFVNTTQIRGSFTYADNKLNDIIFIIQPCNYEQNNATRIAKYNDEKAYILIVGDQILDELPELISNEFGIPDGQTQSNIIVTMESISANIADDKIVINSVEKTKLLVDTGKFLYVKDSVGNATKYRLIISQLQYPFVNFASTKPNFKNSDLDIYKLFLEADVTKLVEYYNNNELYVGTGSYYGNGEIDLLKNTISDSALTIFNLEKGTILNEKVADVTFSLLGGDNADSFVEFDKTLQQSNEITVNSVGKNLILIIKLRYKIDATSFDIPVVVNINVSQDILVKYDFDDRTSKTIDEAYFESDEDDSNDAKTGWYGSDEYDNKFMLQATADFNNAVMEYVSFVGGKAEITLNNSNFVVRKLEEDAYKVDDSYNKGFYFEISKVYVNISDVWSELDISKLDFTDENCVVRLKNNILYVNQNNYDAIRIKIEVTTAVGGAKNYYYVQAGGVKNISLYKYNKSEQRIETDNDSIDIKYGEKISIGTKNTSEKYSYYLQEQYLGKLQYRINGGESVYSISDNLLTIGTSPNDTQFTITLFTIYGQLATITVNVSAHYQSELAKKDDAIIDIYAGTEISVKNIVKILNIQTNTEVMDFELLAKTDGLSLENYIIDANNQKIKFKHSVTSYTISKLDFFVLIDELEYYVELNNLQVKESIVKKTEIHLGEIPEENGKITIEGSTWDSLFKGLDTEGLFGLTYSISYGNATYGYNNSKASIVIDIGSITASANITLSFNIKAENGDETSVLFTATAGATINPQYTVETNYSQGSSTSYKTEYVQVGSKLKLDGNTINGVKRVVVNYDESKPTPLISYAIYDKSSEDYTINGSEIEFKNTGEFVISILVGGAVYGTYNVSVLQDSPIGVDLTNIDGQTFYAGYGDDQILNYVDVIVRVPQVVANLKTSEVLPVVSIISKVTKDGADEIVTLASNVYISGSSTQAIRLAVKLETYIQGVTANNIYIRHAYKIDSEDKIDDYLSSATVSKRYRVLYNGYAVDESTYSTLIKLDQQGTSGSYERWHIEVKSKTDLTKANATINSQKEYYYRECDIKIELPEQDISVVWADKSSTTVNFVLNANEKELSLVNMLKITDNLGNQFWYNHVGEQQNLLLEICGSRAVNKNDSLGVASEILLEHVVLSNNTNKYIYDYKVNPIGATNNGTIVTLKLTYSVGAGTTKEVKFEKEIVVKVNSDIKYYVLNNNSTDSSNTKDDKLSLNVINEYVLADADQSTYNNAKFYIYAYGLYDEAQKNVAQSFKYEISGNGTYARLYKNDDGDLIFAYMNKPEFGDKEIEITLTDNFGFTIKYYIVLIAEQRITSVSVNQESFYESESLVVYNSAGNDATGTKGISLKIEDENGDLETSKVYINEENCSVKIDNVQLTSGDIKWNISDSNITFGYQSQTFWEKYSVNGLAVTITLLIPINLGTSTDEYYTIERSFVLYKRYELSIKSENTYVRDGEEFEIANMVSVYDYSMGSYLGEPVIEKAEAIKLDFELNEDFTVSTESNEHINITYEYYNGTKTVEDKDAKLKLTNINIYELMQRVVTNNYAIDDENNTLGSFVITYNDGTEEKTEEKFSETTANIILEALNIFYSGDGEFSQEVVVEAIYKDSSAGIPNIESKYATVTFNAEKTDLDDPETKDIDETNYSGDIYANSENYIYLGKYQTAFGTSEINLTDYNFKIYHKLYEGIKDGVETNHKILIGDTSESDLVSSNYPMVSSLFENKGTDENKIKIATTTEVTVLRVVSADSTKLYLKADNLTDLLQVDIKKGANVIYLDEYNDQITSSTEYLEKITNINLSGAKLELYTGPCELSSDVYCIPSEISDATVICYNGFLIDDNLRAKNIERVKLYDEDGETKDQDLYTTSGFSVDSNGVSYQLRTVTLKYDFSSHLPDGWVGTEEDFAFVSNNQQIRITLKYTGIDVSNAYVGNAKLAIVQISNSGIEGNIVSGTSKFIVAGDIFAADGTIQEHGWASNFKLIPGVGKIAEIAKKMEANELGFTTIDETSGEAKLNEYLTFKLKSVTDLNGASVTEANIVSITTDGKIELKTGFNIKNYYISIDVGCLYPTGTGATELLSKSIGTIYLAFNVATAS